jgi:hypothetical protein
MWVRFAGQFDMMLFSRVKLHLLPMNELNPEHVEEMFPMLLGVSIEQPSTSMVLTWLPYLLVRFATSWSVTTCGERYDEFEFQGTS